ncbi:DNA-binding transcriptional MerR regulator [Streptomyces puniciscabiei]|uniref:DNA-binding transcriptional MerR regulator n=1 Tax=Streptomyces puniciscabiei TaxID=164348 RepID=A0A542SZ41_9ACTN|nr:MerR family transcriptional regulator [Streptomyces puniciscabiei]TQK79879.1 DNA-binding transcriptional MerR regulator [Streptomyces puniciscabiei]
MDPCAPVVPQLPRPDGRDSHTIREVAALTGLRPHTLRGYEQIGLLPQVDRSHAGQRRFDDRDLEWLTCVTMLRLTGMPVADMVRYAELVRQGAQTYEERHRMLERTRREVLARSAELHDTLTVLDAEIDFYADARRVPEGA